MVEFDSMRFKPLGGLTSESLRPPGDLWGKPGKADCRAHRLCACALQDSAISFSELKREPHFSGINVMNLLDLLRRLGQEGRDPTARNRPISDCRIVRMILRFGDFPRNAKDIITSGSKETNYRCDQSYVCSHLFQSSQASAALSRGTKDTYGQLATDVDMMPHSFARSAHGRVPRR